MFIELFNLSLKVNFLFHSFLVITVNRKAQLEGGGGRNFWSKREKNVLLKLVDYLLNTNTEITPPPHFTLLTHLSLLQESTHLDLTESK